jgi:UDP-N-acetylmuramoylalanine--D-glutamate ligase
LSDQHTISVLGAGESGTGAAILAVTKGYNVFVSDNGTIKPEYKDLLKKYEIEWEEGTHSSKRILSSTEVIKSPGITNKAPLISELHNLSIPVISEIEFAARHTHAKLIGITGSNGKTTTTLLTHHILTKAGLNPGLCGNVGKSFALQVAKNEHDLYVLELSSFQLDDMHTVNLDIAMILNITEDHLDRYDYSMEKYTRSKFRITKNLKKDDHFIYCSDDPVITTEITKRNITARHYPFSLTQRHEQGAYCQDDSIIINTNQTNYTMSIYDLALQGKHNIYNSMAAGIASRILEIRKEIVRESLSDFQNIEHRLEFVATVQGIEFINDSKATNINSTWYALESMSNPVIWIVGGVDKGNDYAMLAELVKDKVKAIVCLGLDNAKIIEAFTGIVEQISEANTAEDAVRAAYYLAKRGDTVLLSPACASFDLFVNYEDRGHKFKSAVRSL